MISGCNYPVFFLIAATGAVPIVAQKILPDDAPYVLRFKLKTFVYMTLGAAASVLYIYASIVLLNKGYYGT